jgi:lysozyme
MELWRKAEFEGERIVIDALVRRRASEKLLFLTPPDGWPVAPTPLLQPLLDAEAKSLELAEAPVPVTAILDGDEVRVLRAEEPPPPPVPPDEEEEGPSPVQAAAEAVAARLQAIFPEEAEAAAAELAGREPPLPTAEPEAGFELTPPAEDLEDVRTALLPDAPEEAEGPLSGDLFAAPAAAEAETPDDDAPPVAPFAPERRLIDDTAPYEFTPPFVQPLRTETRGGPVSLIALAVIGLAFFGGGVFWALNARSSVAAGAVSPLLVGWLAGIAGVGLFSIAVFLLLQGLDRNDR